MRPVLANSTRIGRYLLVRHIGDGAFGTVWRARNTEDGRDYAIKLFSRGRDSASQSSPVVRESRMTERLSHPNIVKVYDVGICGEYHYIVSELIEGLSLDSWLKRFACDPTLAARWCAIIARALEHAHSQGIVHRDLKPANIMIDRNDNIHLMDFGLAKQDEDELTSDIERYQLARYRLQHTDPQSEAAGPLLGTPAYMSPEQALGEGYYADHRSDIYSLGVILYELLTRRRPFRGKADRLVRLLRCRQPAPPHWYNARVPRSLEAVCLKAMARNPEDRFASAAELAEECERFATGQTLHTRPVSRLWLTIRWIVNRLATLRP